jgi:hypothetical protein
MGNIVGEGFDQIIIDQINQRQKIYGSINRTNEQLNYLNNRTGWCRLVSSVDVKESVRNLRDRDANLAKNFILFNGTSAISNTNSPSDTKKINYFQRGGVWPGTNNTDPNDYAYGIGGTEFGLRPMPGITQATIKTETRGSLKTATVNIQANNREQFDIIDILYLRLGFTVLLEWGNSSYYRNNGSYEPNNPNTLVDDFLTGKNLTYDNYPEKINEKRLASDGNYDALIGKVVNFNWTFTKEGTYNITLTIRSMGDVIESLKTNILLPSPLGIGVQTSSTDVGTTAGNFSDVLRQTQSTLVSPQSQEVIKSFANTHEIGKEFYRLQQILQSNNKELGNDNNVEAFRQKFTGYKDIYYIRFGYLLKFIEQRIIPTVDKSSLIKIDTDINSNIIYLQARQISTDPGVCVCNRTIKNVIGNSITFFPEGNIFAESKNSSSYGKIMNLYFNMEWILTTMNDLKDENGKTSLFDLINSLCKGWNKVSGNFNKLQPIITEDKTLQIIDELVLPDKNDWLKDPKYSALPLSTNSAEFKVYTKESFIKDVSFNTTISNNLATMITIGATSKGYVVGQDSTALSRMNAGLVDRFKKEINNEGDKGEETQSAQALPDNFKEVYSAFNKFVTQLGGDNPTWNQEAINNFTNTAAQFYEYDQAYQIISPTPPKPNPNTQITFDTIRRAQQAIEFQNQAGGNVDVTLIGPVERLASKKSSPSIGFLPFDLQLKMDGLSGMKIYQAYTIDNNFLPSNYPQSLEFLIKGITNTIQNNEWTTTIESIVVPKTPGGTIIGGGAVENASGNATGDILINTNTTAAQNEVAKQIIIFFTDNGYSREQAAGIAGNLFEESNFRENAENKAGGGIGAYGLAQWRSDRQTALFKFAADKDKNQVKGKIAAKTQLEFILQEFESTEKSARNSLKQQSTVEDSARSFGLKYERFVPKSGLGLQEQISLNRRIAYSKKFFELT